MTYRYAAGWTSNELFGIYPNEPNTTVDVSNNFTLGTSQYTTMAKHIVGTLHAGENNFFMFNADFAGTLTMNFVHPDGEGGSGAPVVFEFFNRYKEAVFTITANGSGVFSHDLPIAGLYYFNVRAADGIGSAPFALLPALSDGANNRLLAGTDANDVFEVNGGNDTIVGNGGYDIVRYASTRTESLVTCSDAGVGVHTLGQGKDTLIGIERIEFSDRVVDFGNHTDAACMYRIYDAVFNRAPDDAGIGFWVHALENGYDLLGLATHFMRSDEFRSMYGDNPTNRDLVTGYYRNILDREPEPAGIDFWLGVLDQGRATKEEVMVAISESGEHQTLLVGQISHGVAYIPYH